MDYKMPPREQDSNKSTFGKVLNISGSKNYIGAAYLSSIGVLKSGAGYLALASDKNILRAVSSLLPEAVFMELREVKKKISAFTTVLIGCGLGTGSASVKIFKQVLASLKNSSTPLIIDADGLNILAETKMELPENTVITPHIGEASRLLGMGIEDILQDREHAAKALSKKYKCVTVLKSHRTVICDKNLNTFTNTNGNSALAKAGSGDLLAGIITGLAAQKTDLFKASKLGVYLHARAGELASKDLTEYSVNPTDLIKYLPKAISELL